MVFWGPKDTTITFCEETYKNSSYIAEYYNSLSGVVYSLVGVYFFNTKFNPMSKTPCISYIVLILLSYFNILFIVFRYMFVVKTVAY